MIKKYFGVYAWIYLFLNVAVILDGALVRATGSGAGCGAHWPLCQGAVFPNLKLLSTLIEFTHRVGSGVVGLGAIFLVAGAFFGYPKKHPVRYGSAAVLGFVIFEALLGAGLVLFGLVENNLSTTRIVVMGLHLANTFLLLAAITLTAVSSRGVHLSSRGIAVSSRGIAVSSRGIAVSSRGFVLSSRGIAVSSRGLTAGSSSAPRDDIFLIAFCLLLLFLTGITGGITALGDTLLKPNYLGENFLRDLTSPSHILQTLRAVHPFMAVITSIVLAYVVSKLGWKDDKTRILGITVLVLICVQIVVGILNLTFLTPIVLQQIHLFLADSLWIVTILYFSLCVQYRRKMF